MKNPGEVALQPLRREVCIWGIQVGQRVNFSVAMPSVVSAFTM